MGITWGEFLATGIQHIDEQHKEIFRRLNSFLDACDQGKEKGELLGLLQFLDDYTVIHFRDEERFLAANHYSDLVRHQGFHRGFVEQLGDFKKRFMKEGPNATLVTDINRYAVGWLLHHIGEKDKDFAREILSREGMP